MTVSYKFLKRFSALAEDDITFYKESLIENIWETIETLIEADAVDVIVLDSLSALQTNQEDQKEISGHTIASMPKQMNKLIKKFYKVAEDSGITFIIINSAYTDTNGGQGMMSAPKMIIKGGKALALAKSVSIKITKSFSKYSSKVEKINGVDTLTEVYTKYTTEKNKLGAPKREASTFLDVNPNNSKTFLYAKDVLSYASELGFIKRGGAWFEAFDVSGESLYKCQGGDRMSNYIEANPALYIKLKLSIYSKIYQPFEFYYQFDKIKSMLIKEYECIQNDLTRDLRFTVGIDETEREAYQEVIDEKTNIGSFGILDLYKPLEVEKAVFELSNFYDEDKMNKLAKVNKVEIKDGYVVLPKEVIKAPKVDLKVQAMIEKAKAKKADAE